MLKSNRIVKKSLKLAGSVVMNSNSRAHLALEQATHPIYGEVLVKNWLCKSDNYLDNCNVKDKRAKISLQVVTKITTRDRVVECDDNQNDRSKTGWIIGSPQILVTAR
jgi:hypothetical protein